MKIRILQNTVAELKNVKKDDVLECNDKDAKYLIAIGKAEIVKEKADKAHNADAEPHDPPPEVPPEHETKNELPVKLPRSKR